MKHTPGRWYKSWNADYEGWCIYAPATPSPGFPAKVSWQIASVGNVSPKTPKAEIEGNACLIAAAPIGAKLAEAVLAHEYSREAPHRCLYCLAVRGMRGLEHLEDCTQKLLCALAREFQAQERSK